MKFKLEIKMGNAAMLTPSDVAAALQGVVATLEDTDVDAGNIRDDNGNTVGKWQFTGKANKP